MLLPFHRLQSIRLWFALRWRLPGREVKSCTSHMSWTSAFFFSWEHLGPGASAGSSGEGAIVLLWTSLNKSDALMSCIKNWKGSGFVVSFFLSFYFFSFHRNFMSLEDFILFFLCDRFHRAFHHLSSLVSWTDVAGSEGHDELVTVQGHFRQGGGWGKRARLVDATRGWWPLGDRTH